MTFRKGEVTNPAGREPKRLDAAALDLVEELAMRGSHETTIAHQVGVSLPTWRRMKERDRKVAAAWARGRARNHDYFVNCLGRMAKANNVAAAIFMLKAKHGYSDQGDAADSRPHITINLPGALTPQRYAEVIEADAVSEALPPPELTTQVQRG